MGVGRQRPVRLSCVCPEKRSQAGHRAQHGRGSNLTREIRADWDLLDAGAPMVPPGPWWHWLPGAAFLNSLGWNPLDIVANALKNPACEVSPPQQLTAAHASVGRAPIIISRANRRRQRGT